MPRSCDDRLTRASRSSCPVRRHLEGGPLRRSSDESDRRSWPEGSGDSLHDQVDAERSERADGQLATVAVEQCVEASCCLPCPFGCNEESAEQRPDHEALPAPANTPPPIACPARDGAACSCRPAYEAWVWSVRERKKIRKKFTSVAEAKSWRADAIGAVRVGRMRSPSRVTLQEAADAWLEGVRDGSNRTVSGDVYKPSTIRACDQALQLRILPEFGTRRIGELSRHDQQDLADRMRNDGLNASTVRNTFLPLRAIYRRGRQPVRSGCQPSHRSRARGRAWTARSDRYFGRGRAAAQRTPRRGARTVGDRVLRGTPPRRTASASLAGHRPRRRSDSSRTIPGTR